MKHCATSITARRSKLSAIAPDASENSMIGKRGRGLHQRDEVGRLSRSTSSSMPRRRPGSASRGSTPGWRTTRSGRCRGTRKERVRSRPGGGFVCHAVMAGRRALRFRRCSRSARVVGMCRPNACQVENIPVRNALRNFRARPAKENPPDRSSGFFYHVRQRRG